MKKILSLITCLLISLSFTGCGSDLSFKQGGVNKVVGDFIKAVKSGKKESALKYALSNLPKNQQAELEKFVSLKADEIEVVGEEIVSILELLRTDLIEAKGKEFGKLVKKEEDLSKSKNAKKVKMLKEQRKKIVTALVAVSPNLKRIFFEKSVLVKVTAAGSSKYYVLTVFASQNLQNITGVFEMPSAIKEKLDESDIGTSYKKEIFRLAFSMMPDDPDSKKEEEKKEEDQEEEKKEETK